MKQEKSERKTNVLLKIFLFLLFTQLFFALLRFIMPPYIFVSDGGYIFGLIFPCCIVGIVLIIRKSEGPNSLGLVFLKSLLSALFIVLPSLFIFGKMDNAIWKVRNKLTFDYDNILKVNLDAVPCNDLDFSLNMSSRQKAAKITIVDLDEQCHDRFLMSKLPSNRRLWRTENMDFIIYLQMKDPSVQRWTDGLDSRYISYREVISAFVYDCHNKTYLGCKIFTAREVKDDFTKVRNKKVHLSVSDFDIADWIKELIK